MTPAIIIAAALAIALIIAGLRMHKKIKPTPDIIRSIEINKKS
jgi:hypothetical protein